jgi:hypothetical protein
MDEERLSSEQERAWLDLLEKAALKDFPNPERIGCSGSEFLRTLARDRKSISPHDPRIGHLARCSPCFQEFTEFRSGTAERQGRKPGGKSAAIVVVLLLAIGAASYYERVPLTSEATRVYTRLTGTYVSASLDLKGQSRLRGTNAPNVAAPDFPATLPRQRLDLAITLPFASEPGAYDLEILRDSSPPLAAISGQAQIEDGNTVLAVKIDLSSLSPGEYQLRVRRMPFDWVTYSVSVE